ncbi:uncharacterized protein LOC108459020 [Gossypium arboreum]|uniref:uncharacterized protein LOC108459020 n=1 Tax=Gossypium arboreum TaxID=29729 RepID=UPI000819372C|nr:uncharacterized protein LOC108459020 [Gossypium arboreum]
MPNYVKFMKDILSKKKMLGKFYRLALIKECSEFVLNKLLLKMKDPGNFTVPCNIGESYYGKALYDLRASINLTPMFIFNMLGISDVRPTTMTLQLVDQSLARLEGKIENVLVHVDKFIFPTKFIVLDFEADKKVLIILGRPFLVTGRILINVQKGELTMRVQDDQVTFNVIKAMKFPNPVEECSVMEQLETLVSIEWECNSVEDHWKTP